ncbi:glycosyltransferase [Bogoriella caseilytica]|uniref:Flp pilus-assembly TadE/G-like protein n=1 Tax=Bogoriella caseilytica TaxID=56055 RepID=A0A3N2BEN2_9MICO|nr:glycosyltransferase [Bogoriella caseilytica]ROR73721.1 hypothetical protein EDD31_2109 [Bogoriella caseilytica]
MNARRSRRPGSGEDGGILVLTMGLMAIAAGLILVVASVSALHIEHKRLLALADSAAVAAADALDESYFEVRGAELPLSDASVLAAVEEHLAAQPPALLERFDHLTIVSPTGSPDGSSAQVSLGAVTSPAFLPFGLVPGREGFALEVTATARAAP